MTWSSTLSAWMLLIVFIHFHRTKYVSTCKVDAFSIEVDKLKNELEEWTSGCTSKHNANAICRCFNPSIPRVNSTCQDFNLSIPHVNTTCQDFNLSAPRVRCDFHDYFVEVLSFIKLNIPNMEDDNNQFENTLKYMIVACKDIIDFDKIAVPNVVPPGNLAESMTDLRDKLRDKWSKATDDNKNSFRSK